MSEHVNLTLFSHDTSLPFYERLRQSVRALTEGEPDLIANTANISSLLFEELNKKKNNSINWVGFYFVKGNQLVLGPFQGFSLFVFNKYKEENDTEKEGKIHTPKSNKFETFSE
jgi:putative methionine-R-sulfoxide reductase with GAF domain